MIQRISGANLRTSMHVDTSIGEEVVKARLGYFGRVVRMKPARYQKIILLDYIENRNRVKKRVGRPQLTWVQCLEGDCQV